MQFYTKVYTLEGKSKWRKILAENKIQYNFLEKGEPSICKIVLRSLPDWFGIEESTVAYINKSQELPMIVATEGNRPVGFISLKKHSPFTSEVYVMGIIPQYHRHGIGKMLLVEAEKFLLKIGVEFLQVKTVSSDRECSFYKKTRLFYQSFGFKEVEIFPTLWNESNPCQLLIKNVSYSERFHRLHAVYLFVNNVKESSFWYSNVLKIPLTINDENFGQIRVGQNELCFHQADTKCPLTTGGSVGYWQVANLLEVANLFIKYGGTIYRGPIEIHETDEGICQIRDPFGNVIGLQGKYRKEHHRFG